MQNAVAYFRTSSASGVGDDKDSETRQRESVIRYAEKNNFTIIADFYDKAVSGVDPVASRPAFNEMISYMKENNIGIILIETANRFARDLVVQITGHDFLKANGITLIPVDAPDHFTNETPTAVMIRQILGAVSQFEKSCLVDRMRKGADKKRELTGRCEGRIPPPPEAVSIARKLHRKGWPLRRISDELLKAGYSVYKKGEGFTGRKYPAASVKNMVENMKMEKAA